MEKKSKTMKYPLLVGAVLAFLIASVAFAYEATPIALTAQPTFITEKWVQLNGRVNPSELPDTSIWFEWGISGRPAVYETRHEHLWGANQLINTNVTLVGLAPNTQYFYRQVAENSHGKDVGQTVYVTTKSLSAETDPIALVSTYDATLIEDGATTLRGYLSPHGDASTKVWFEWGMTPSMSNQTGVQGTWGDSSIVEVRLQGLKPGTLYYFRAVAENNDGRTAGTVKVFSTTGSSFVSTEAPRAQVLPSSSTGGGTVSHTTVAQGAGPVTFVLGVEPDHLPQGQNRPGDFFSVLFGSGEKKSANTSSVNNAGGGLQVAAVLASGFLPGSELLTGKKDIEVAVGKIGPNNVLPHTPVEYRIAYAYRRTSSATDAKLRITIPGDVVYIGDNTNNELLLQPGNGSERTYVLPLGKIIDGSTRTISIMGITTGDAKGFPDAVVELDYADKGGTHVIGAGSDILFNNMGAEQNSASVASASARGKILPSSLWSWIVYVLVVIGAVIGIRKARVYYVKSKESLAQIDLPEREHLSSDEGSDTQVQTPRFLPGATEIESAVVVQK